MRPIPHRAHRRFVEVEGWEKTQTVRGTTGDHHRYVLHLADGSVLRTRVSHGAGALNDPGLVAAVLRDQLAVTAADFWACVDRKVLPPRPLPAEPAMPAGPKVLDAKLARSLLGKAGVTHAELATMTQAEAAARWIEFLKG